MFQLNRFTEWLNESNSQEAERLNRLGLLDFPEKSTMWRITLSGLTWQELMGDFPEEVAEKHEGVKIVRHDHRYLCLVGPIVEVSQALTEIRSGLQELAMNRAVPMFRFDVKEIPNVPNWAKLAWFGLPHSIPNEWQYSISETRSAEEYSRLARLIQLGLEDPKSLVLRHVRVAVYDPQSDDPKKRVPSVLTNGLDSLLTEFDVAASIKHEQRQNDGRLLTTWEWVAPESIAKSIDQLVDQLIAKAEKIGPKPLLREPFGYPEYRSHSWEARSEPEFDFWLKGMGRTNS